MLQFQARIEALKLKATRKHKRSDLLNEAFKIIDELHAAYQRAWQDECNTAGAMEILREQMAVLTTTTAVLRKENTALNAVVTQTVALKEMLDYVVEFKAHYRSDELTPHAPQDSFDIDPNNKD